MKELAFRLHKGDDLKKSLIAACKESSAVILSGVGCVDQLVIRLAGAKDYFESREDYEIVSLTGTVSNGKAHIHGSFSDVKGNCVGGHLCEGCIVNTTCEVVLGILEEYDSFREYDEKTGYEEIVFRRKVND